MLTLMPSGGRRAMRRADEALATLRVVCWLPLVARLPAPAQADAWPAERPPRPLAARERQVSAVRDADAAERPAGGGRAAPRAAGRQHADDRARRRRARSEGQARPRATSPPSLLDQGTTTKSANEMNDAIDFIGGAMGAGAGTDLTLRQHGRDEGQLRDGLRMLSDMARRPAFAPDEIERQRQQMLSALQVSFEDPEFVADAVFDRLVYGFHPYGMPQTGTPETLAAHHARRSRRVPPALLRAEQRHPRRSSATSRPRRRSTGVKKVFGDWERARRAGRDVHRAARSDAARDRRQQAGRGADRGPRRPSRRPAATIPTTWRSTWRSAFSAARAPTGCTRCCAPSAG